MTEESPKHEAFNLSLAESFSKQHFLRSIEECGSVEQLRQIATLLLDGWYSQRAATKWVMRQTLSAPITSKPEDIL